MEDFLIIKLLLAVIVGALIGAEREFRTGIGLRTLTLICLGATLFTIYSDFFAIGEGDPRRIAAAVVTGVGFLGAGMILRHHGGIFGLTTAATVWLVAALGMGIGIGQYLLVAVATVLVLIVLWAIPYLQRLTNARQTLSYEVFIPLLEPKYEDLFAVMRANNLKVSKNAMSKSETGINYVWQAYGKPDSHRSAMLALMEKEDVKEFRAV
ncbi:MAG: MgtC/SapB family protein [Chloroflexi bacterium]|jgi:putative Mg2+ transporter-C (MgtC) family protein|nr:MgtC/SapB family protein [Chloroflexota bacterium]